MKPANSHRKNGNPSIPALSLKPDEKANQNTNIVTVGFIIAHDHPSAAPLYVLIRSDLASVKIWLFHSICSLIICPILISFSFSFCPYL